MSENSTQPSPHLRSLVGGSPNHHNHHPRSPQQHLFPHTFVSPGHLPPLAHRRRGPLHSASHGQHRSLRKSRNRSTNARLAHWTSGAPVLFALSRVIRLGVLRTQLSSNIQGSLRECWRLNKPNIRLVRLPHCPHYQHRPSGLLLPRLREAMALVLHPQCSHISNL